MERVRCSASEVAGDDNAFEVERVRCSSPPAGVEAGDEADIDSVRVSAGADEGVATLSIVVGPMVGAPEVEERW